MRRYANAVMVGVLSAVAGTATGQIRPQITPFVTGDNCRAYQNFTPDSLRVEQKTPPAATAQKDSSAGGAQQAPQAVATGATSNKEIAKARAEDIRKCLIQLSGAVQSLAAEASARPVAEKAADKVANRQAGSDAASRAGLQSQGAKAADEAMAAGSTEADKAEEVVHIQLVKVYLAFRNMQRWKQFVDRWAPTETADTTRRDVVTEYDALAERLHAVLGKHGLTQPFAANLVTAFALNATGSTPSGKTGSTASTTSPATTPGATPATATPAATSTGTDTAGSAAGFVTWESIHFYAAPDRSFDFNLAGTFGFQPVFGLVQPAAGQPATSSDVTATFQQGFVWTVAANPNWRVADLAEVTALARIGQSILSSTNTLTEDGAKGIVQVSAANGTGRAELFGEVGARISIYGQSLEVLHLKRGLLSPMFAFAAGIRFDNRFAQSGVLADVRSSNQRVFLRFQIDGLQLANKNQADSAFTVGFSADFDGPLHRTGTNFVPSGTRLLIRGDLNLFKAAQAQK